MTGKVEYLDSGGSEIYGHIRSSGIIARFLLLGRNLEGYCGESLYKIGLVEGATVSFDVEQGSDAALNIRVENKSNKFFLAFRLSWENLKVIIFLLVGICAILVFKKLAAYLLTGFLFLWVIHECQEIHEKLK